MRFLDSPLYNPSPQNVHFSPILAKKKSVFYVVVSREKVISNLNFEFLFEFSAQRQKRLNVV